MVRDGILRGSRLGEEQTKGDVGRGTVERLAQLRGGEGGQKAGRRVLHVKAVLLAGPNISLGGSVLPQIDYFIHTSPTPSRLLPGEAKGK